MTARPLIGSNSCRLTPLKTIRLPFKCIKTKEQLAEYLHDFKITDDRLWSLNNDQFKFHQDCLKYLQQFEIILANKQVVVDENVINDIKNLVQAETGFNLRDYVSNEQKALIT